MINGVRIALGLLVLVSVFCAPSSSFAQVPEVLKTLKKRKVEHKDDVVLMDNGDRNTGEIKKLEFGVLYLKSNRAADTLKLDWKRVMRVQSRSRYEFEIEALTCLFCWRKIFIFLMAKSGMRFTNTIHFCRAKCSLREFRAATVMIPTVWV
jgi:hypothetical protein